MKQNLIRRKLIKLLIACLYTGSMYLLPSCKKESAGKAAPPIDTIPALTEVLIPVTTAVNNLIGGYYVGLPSDYDRTSLAYPLLIFVTGAGQFGNGSYDLPLLLKDGPAQLIDEKKFPGSFKLADKTYSFIVFTPQCKTYPRTADIKDCIDLAKKKYRVDTTRIYLSGLSIGSITACSLAAEVPAKIAAIVAMAGVPTDYASTDQCRKLAANNLPVWAFHSEDDPTINVSVTKGFISKLASYNPAIMPKLTLWANGGHDAWTRALNPDYKEGGLNIYEWMLQYHR